MKFGRNVWIWMDLTSRFQDWGHGVNSRRKVPPSGEYSRSVCGAHMQQNPAVPDLYYYSTFVVFVFEIRSQHSTRLWKNVYESTVYVLTLMVDRCTCCTHEVSAHIPWPFKLSSDLETRSRAYYFSSASQNESLVSLAERVALEHFLHCTKCNHVGLPIITHALIAIRLTDWGFTYHHIST